MNDNPLVSYVLATYNRPDDLAEAVQSIVEQHYRPIEIVIVSSSTDETSELFEPGGRFDDEWIRYYEFSERMGVPGARNIGYERASGDILATIDDDAVLRDAGATDDIVSAFRERDDVGAVAFQSRRYDTGELIRQEIPGPPDFTTPPSESYETTTIIGVGNAIRPSVFEAAGKYPEHFVYGQEEMDLSLRILNAGYDILYLPSVVVRHKKSAKGRRPDIEERERQIENRIKLAVRNLPGRYVLFTALVWCSYWLLRSGLRFSSLSRILRRLYAARHDLLAERDVIDDATIELLKDRSSMLFLWWFGPHPRRIFGPGGNLRRLTW